MVDRTGNFKSNASWFKQKKYEKNAPQARVLRKQMRRGQALSNKMRRGPEFFTQS